MRTHKRPLPGVFLVDCIEDDDGTDIMNDTEDQVCPNCGGTGRLADFRPDTDPTDNALLNPRARHSSRVGGATKLERKAETFSAAKRILLAKHDMPAAAEAAKFANACKTEARRLREANEIDCIESDLE